MSVDELIFEVDGPVARIVINRPDRRNAINTAVREGLIDALEAIEADASIRVGLVTGTGDAFSAGMDLKEFSEGTRKYSDRPNFFRFERTKPMIAAVNGIAVAGGFELVLACDLAIAADTAEFGLSEVQRGLLPGGGGLFRLARLVGPRRANELLLTGRRFDAAEAERLGVVNRVVARSELDEAARSVAEQVAAGAPLAVTAALALGRQAVAPPESELWDEMAERVRAVNGSNDAREGAAAFLERRAPRWTGT